jgi:hypothetical protein
MDDIEKTFSSLAQDIEKVLEAFDIPSPTFQLYIYVSQLSFDTIKHYKGRSYIPNLYVSFSLGNALILIYNAKIMGVNESNPFGESKSTATKDELLEKIAISVKSVILEHNFSVVSFNIAIHVPRYYYNSLLGEKDLPVIFVHRSDWDVAFRTTMV